MTTTTTTTENNNAITTVHAFLPTIGKTGKVSATSEKVALVLNNVNRDGLTALARDAKGAIGAQARKAVLGSAFGLPQIRVATRLERDQWGNALSLLVGEYGPQYLNRATMRGRDGTVAYLQAVERAALVRFDGAETPVQQERTMKAVNAIRADLDVMVNLVGVAEAEIMAQRSIVAPVAEVAEVAEVVAPVAEVVAPVAEVAAPVAEVAEVAKPSKAKKRAIA